MLKLLNRFSQNSVNRWQMGHGKKPLDFDDNQDHITFDLGLG